MSPVPEAGKKISKSKSHRRKERKKEKRKSKHRLHRRLEKYKRILEQAKATRKKPSCCSSVNVQLPGNFLEISSRIVASINTAVQTRLLPFQINSQPAMSGNSFWMNYQHVFHWKDQHMSNMSRATANPNLRAQQQPPRNSQIKKRHQATHDEYSLDDATPQGEFDHTDDGPVPEEDAAEDNDSDCDIEVTEEMMQFLEISMRHKAKREQEKLAAKERDDKKRIEERDAIVDCQVPTEEDENEKRLREMTELYGEDAPKIHGMETALQLNFNRQLDLFNPPQWPFYPFSIVFKGVTALK